MENVARMQNYNPLQVKKKGCFEEHLGKYNRKGCLLAANHWQKSEIVLAAGDKTMQKGFEKNVYNTFDAKKNVPENVQNGRM